VLPGQTISLAEIQLYSVVMLKLSPVPMDESSGYLMTKLNLLHRWRVDSFNAKKSILKDSYCTALMTYRFVPTNLDSGQ
jgi:hypothetical protein